MLAVSPAKELVTCKTCGTVFEAYKKHHRIFCSRKCKRNNGPHNQSGTRLHNIWCGMKARTKSNTPFLKKYYGHVSVCDDWKSFVVFMEWSLANGYQEHLELDRIDPNGNYCPENCRWATRNQQMQNTRIRNQKNKTSRFRGVQKLKTKAAKCWRANGFANGKPVHLGVFETELEAAEAYNTWAKSNYGEFACLNNFEMEVSHFSS